MLDGVHAALAVDTFHQKPRWQLRAGLARPAQAGLLYAKLLQLSEMCHPATSRKTKSLIQVRAVSRERHVAATRPKVTRSLHELVRAQLPVEVRQRQQCERRGTRG